MKTKRKSWLISYRRTDEGRYIIKLRRFYKQHKETWKITFTIKSKTI